MSDEQPKAREHEGAHRPDGIGPVKPGGGRARKGAERAHLEARRIKVEQLELAGHSIRAIAKRVHIAEGTVVKDLKAIRQARRVEWGSATVEEHRDRELTRLEDMRRQLLDLTEGVVMPSMAHDLLRVHDRLSKLLGLAAPTRVEVSISTDTVGDKLEAYLAGVNDAQSADVGS